MTARCADLLGLLILTILSLEDWFEVQSFVIIKN